MMAEESRWSASPTRRAVRKPPTQLWKLQQRRRPVRRKTAHVRRLRCMRESCACSSGRAGGPGPPASCRRRPAAPAASKAKAVGVAAADSGCAARCEVRRGGQAGAVRARGARGEGRGGGRRCGAVRPREALQREGAHHPLRVACGSGARRHRVVALGGPSRWQQRRQRVCQGQRWSSTCRRQSARSASAW